MVLRAFIEQIGFGVRGYNFSPNTYKVKVGEGRTEEDVARLSKLHVMYVVFDKDVEEKKDFLVLTAGAAEWVQEKDAAGQHIHSFYDLDVAQDKDGVLWLQKPRELMELY